MDDYDFEDDDDSGSALSGLASSLINSGTEIATTALQNSSIAAQPSIFQTIPISPTPASSSSGLIILAVVALIALVIYKVF